MIVKIADNIISPLGMTTRDNLDAVRAGRSALKLHQRPELPEPVMASLFPDEGEVERSYESLVLLSVSRALAQVPRLATESSDVVLILSSTKGASTGDEGEPLGETALRVARRLGITTAPLTVSNACISGLAAQILAMRLLESRRYRTAIVVGCDVQSHFIISGFQSLKALSVDECRPFDEERYGLNLGEAAATIIYQYKSVEEVTSEDWVISRGCVRNDAYHISAPSRTAEGCYRALSYAVADIDPTHIACISAHGTATLYNDDMESRAIDRAGLNDLLVSGLKGYYGHTMGAAGLLETIISMHAIDEGWIPGTRGYAACGTVKEIHICKDHQPTSCRTFVKLMSGFGGCNAAALFQKGGQL